jgi:hypothetical protein
VEKLEFLRLQHLFNIWLLQVVAAAGCLLAAAVELVVLKQHLDFLLQAEHHTP